MQKIRIIFYAVLLSFLSITAFSQQENPPALVTDRPDQTESSVVVPEGYLQIETGFVFEKTSDMQDNITYHSTLLRYGLLDIMELRIGNELTEDGMAPVNVGTKIFITHENGILPELAFMAGVTLPYFGSDLFTPEHIAPSMRLAAAHTLTDNFSFGWNFGGEWKGTDSETNGFYSGVPGIGLREKLGAFIELYGYLPEDHKADHRFDAGFTYLLKSNFQFDVSGGLGLNEVAPDGFVNAGFSYRISS